MTIFGKLSERVGDFFEEVLLPEDVRDRVDQEGHVLDDHEAQEPSDDHHPEHVAQEQPSRHDEEHVGPDRDREVVAVLPSEDRVSAQVRHVVVGVAALALEEDPADVRVSEAALRVVRVTVGVCLCVMVPVVAALF